MAGLEWRREYEELHGIEGEDRSPLWERAFEDALEMGLAEDEAREYATECELFALNPAALFGV